MANCFNDLYDHFYRGMKEIYESAGLNEQEIYDLIDVDGINTGIKKMMEKKQMFPLREGVLQRDFSKYLLYTYTKTFELHSKRPGLLIKLDKFYQNDFFKKMMECFYKINNEKDMYLYHTEMMGSMMFFSGNEKKKAEIAWGIKKEILQKYNKYHWHIPILSDFDIRALSKLGLIKEIVDFFIDYMKINNINTKESVRNFWNKSVGQTHSFGGESLIETPKYNIEGKNEFILEVMREIDLNLIGLLNITQKDEDKNYFVYSGDVGTTYCGNNDFSIGQLEKEIKNYKYTKPKEFYKLEKDEKTIKVKINKLWGREKSDKIITNLNEVIFKGNSVEDNIDELNEIEKEIYPKLKREQALNRSLKKLKTERADIKKKKI